MSSKFTIEATKTYATEANADKAVATLGLSHIRHFMARDDSGRWFPVFVGAAAAEAGVHFHFNVVA